MKILGVGQGPERSAITVYHNLPSIFQARDGHGEALFAVSQVQAQLAGNLVPRIAAPGIERPRFPRLSR
jgi:hypothetical protein